MDLHDDFFPMLMVFLIVFGIVFGVFLAIFFQINVWWALQFTELGNSYTRNSIPIETQWEVFFDAFFFNLIFCIPLAAVVAGGVTALVSD
jgi:ABC-type lipoprotein release transport system permease subunit